jgi:phage/plasmid-associated DNA primase
MRDVEINKVLGDCVLEPWILANEPFKEEFLGGRLWNRDAPQLRYKPKEDEPFNHPTWDKILEQCGKGLDSSVATDGWCKANGISKGADYLKVWVASLFQKPKEQLPYLFLYSKEEKTGKSTFHEALEMLMTSGYTRADVALISSSGFNGELEGSILCVVEETNLQKAVAARNRIKDWVMSKTIMIHHKGRTPYQVRNTVHFVQTGNSVEECPIFSGDTRITMIHVPELDMMDMIPRNQLHQQLKQEAPDFLAEILRVEIPASNDRLNVPIVESEIKKLTAESNRSAIEVFIDEKCFYAPGETVPFSEFFARFQEFLDPMEVHEWSKIKTGRLLPHKYPKGRLPSAASQFHIGNMSFTEAGNADNKKMVLSDTT